MGQDLHGVFEFRPKGQDIWESYSTMEAGRSYRWFGIIASTSRSDKIWHYFKPKGWPEDLSLLSRIYDRGPGNGYHSHSWLSIAEIEEAIDYYVEVEASMSLYEEFKIPDLKEIRRNIIYGGNQYNNLHEWSRFISFCSMRNIEGRAVFCFDN